MKFKDLDESFYHSNKMNKIVQTPMQNIPDPNSGGATGGTTMVTKAYRDLQKDQRNTQAKMDQRQGGGQSYITPVGKTPPFSSNVLPTRTTPKKPRTNEELTDFDKDDPMKSTVAIPGYGTMNIDTLMKNVIDQTTKMLQQMQKGTQGFRNADYALNSNKVLPAKLAALVQALDDLQAIRSKGGARSRNIQQEQAGQELPVDMEKIMGNIQEFESKGYVNPEDADRMRAGVQSLSVPRQTQNPQALLQLLTMVTR